MSNKTLRSYLNIGTQDSNWKGHFPGLFKVWLSVKPMLKILSFKEVRTKFRITVDTAVKNSITYILEWSNY